MAEAPQIAVTIDKAKLHDLEETLRDIKNGAPRAASAAINKTVSTGKVRIARKIHAHLNLRIGQIKEAIGVTKATPATMTGRIKFKRVPVSLIDYNPTNDYPNGLSVLVRHDKGQENIAHAFLATMPSGHEGAFRRAPGAMRLPIKEIRGPTVIGAFDGAPDIARQTLAELGGVLEKNLASQVDRLLKRKKS